MNVGYAMLMRVVIVLAGLAGILPASAGEMNPNEARHFVVGKLFSFTCFEGTRGTGRIYADGSVAGSIQFQGRGPVRFAALPAGTLRVKGQRVCASVRGLFFEPCFYLDKTSHRSFRGSLFGLSFAYCNFYRRGIYNRHYVHRDEPLHLRPSQTDSETVASARAITAP
jgi:hypothetical protein